MNCAIVSFDVHFLAVISAWLFNIQATCTLLVFTTNGHFYCEIIYT